jgi:hypothetical protein
MEARECDLGTRDFIDPRSSVSVGLSRIDELVLRRDISGERRTSLSVWSSLFSVVVVVVVVVVSSPFFLLLDERFLLLLLLLCLDFEDVLSVSLPNATLLELGLLGSLELLGLFTSLEDLELLELFEEEEDEGEAMTLDVEDALSSLESLLRCLEEEEEEEDEEGEATEEEEAEEVRVVFLVFLLRGESSAFLTRSFLRLFSEVERLLMRGCLGESEEEGALVSTGLPFSSMTGMWLRETVFS